MKKLKIRQETVRVLRAREFTIVYGGEIRETEPYSFCTLCEPITRVTCERCPITY